MPVEHPACRTHVEPKVVKLGLGREVVRSSVDTEAVLESDRDLLEGCESSQALVDCMAFRGYCEMKSHCWGNLSPHGEICQRWTRRCP